MTTENNSFGKLLRKHGYSLPETDEEIEAFEKKWEKKYRPPITWPSIEDIISGKPSKVFYLKEDESIEESARLLSMAAREGNQIPEDILQKMKKDRKDAKGK